MSSERKVLDRVQNLIRRANSTGPLPERETAALRAVEMILKHGLTVGEERVTEDSTKGARGARRRASARAPEPPPPPAWAPSPPEPQFVHGRAPRNLRCSFCQEVIPQGMPIYFLPGDGLVIHDWPCKVE